MEIHSLSNVWLKRIRTGKVLVVLGRELSFQTKHVHNGNDLFTDTQMSESIVELISEYNESYSPKDQRLESVLIDAHFEHNLDKSRIVDRLLELSRSRSEGGSIELIRELVKFNCFTTYIDLNNDNQVYKALNEQWGAIGDTVRKINFFEPNSDSGLANVYRDNRYVAINLFGDFEIDEGREDMYTKVALHDDERLNSIFNLIGGGGAVSKSKLFQEIFNDHNFVIFLGCNYADWFNILALKSFLVKEKAAFEDWSNYVIANDHSFESLYFKKLASLRKANIFKSGNNNLYEFIAQLKVKLTDCYDNNTPKTQPAFVSYVGEDSRLVAAAADEMWKLGIDVRIDREGVASLGKLAEKLRTDIKEAGFYIIVLSNNLVERGLDSYAVKHEWPYIMLQCALLKEKEVFPIFIQPDKETLDFEKIRDLFKTSLLLAKSNSQFQNTELDKIENWADERLSIKLSEENIYQVALRLLERTLKKGEP